MVHRTVDFEAYEVPLDGKAVFDTKTPYINEQ